MERTRQEISLSVIRWRTGGDRSSDDIPGYPYSRVCASCMITNPQIPNEYTYGRLLLPAERCDEKTDWIALTRTSWKGVC